MDYRQINSLSQSGIYKSYIPFDSYKPNLYYPKMKKFGKSKRIIRNDMKAIPQSYIYPIIKQNKATSLSPIAGLIQSNPVSYNISSYYTNPNLSASTINNNFTMNPTYGSVMNPVTPYNIYSQNSSYNENIIYNSNSGNNYSNNAEISFLPTKYYSTIMEKPKYNEELTNVTTINYGNTTNILTSQIPKYQPVQSIYPEIEKPVEKEYYIKGQQYTSNLTPISFTQQVNNFSNSSYIAYSTPKISSYSIEKNNDYIYNSENKEEIDNYQLINNITDNSYNSNNNYFENIDTIENKINDETEIEYNSLSQENGVSQENKEIYQVPIETKNDYLINSSNSNEEILESPVYHSYIHKSPEITYNKNLFSPIQTPLANYETQSFNADENVNIEEMLRLKEENGRMKLKLQNLQNKFESQKAQSNELRIQIQQLSPLREKLSEIDSLKTQLLELNALKDKIKGLEELQFNKEENDLNKPNVDKYSYELEVENDSDEQKEENKKINQNKKFVTETKSDLINSIKKQNKNVRQLEISKELETKKSKIKINEKDEPNNIKGEIFHSIEELKMVISKIKTRRGQLILNLIYKATVDSDRAEIFHKICDKAKRSIVLIETDNGRRFGGYTSVSWKGKCLNKKDSSAFIFSFDKMKIYENISGKKAIGCYPKYGPIFLGCQIRIYDEAFKNGGSTFKKGINFRTDEDFVLTGGERLFKIKEIEVYEVIDE